jgi:hypothetical protein
MRIAIVGERPRIAGTFSTSVDIQPIYGLLLMLIGMFFQKRGIENYTGNYHRCFDDAKYVDDGRVSLFFVYYRAFYLCWDVFY